MAFRDVKKSVLRTVMQKNAGKRSLLNFLKMNINEYIFLFKQNYVWENSRWVETKFQICCVHTLHLSKLITSLNPLFIYNVTIILKGLNHFL